MNQRDAREAVRAASRFLLLVLGEAQPHEVYHSAYDNVDPEVDQMLLLELIMEARNVWRPIRRSRRERELRLQEPKRIE